MSKQIDVAVIMGSDSDLPIMKDCLSFLDEMGIAYEVRVLSAHRCTAEVLEYANSLKQMRIKVVIAAAGSAAHLPGILAAVVPCPVIGVPILTKSKALGGADALYSIVQMPSGIPVATVAIDGAKNAAVLASLIIGVSNDEIYKKVCDFKESLKDAVIKKDSKLQEIGYEEYLRQM